MQGAEPRLVKDALQYLINTAQLTNNVPTCEGMEMDVRDLIWRLRAIALVLALCLQVFEVFEVKAEPASGPAHFQAINRSVAQTAEAPVNKQKSALGAQDQGGARRARESCEGPFADPRVKEWGEQIATRIAIEIQSWPLLAFVQPEQFRSRADLYESLRASTFGNRGWISSEGELYDRFLNDLQRSFNENNFWERQLPLQLRLTLGSRTVLGVSASSASGQSLPREGAVIKEEPVRLSPGARAGLRVGDVITSVDGGPIKDALSLAEEIKSRESGEIVELAVYRDGGVITVKVKLAAARGDGGGLIEGQQSGREIKRSLIGCFPNLSHALMLLANRQDEARTRTIAVAAGIPSPPPNTNCGETIKMLSAGSESVSEILETIRAAPLKKVVKNVSGELRSRSAAIALEASKDKPADSRFVEGLNILSREFKAQLIPLLLKERIVMSDVAALIERMDAFQALACFVDLGPLSVELDGILRVGIAEERQLVTQQQVQAERSRREAQREESAARSKIPSNLLASTYGAYMIVRRCSDARQGYSAIFISAPEMDEARAAVTKVERELKAKLAATESVDEIWKNVADQEARSQIRLDGSEFQLQRSLCRQSLEKLLDIVKENVAGGNALKKDF